MDLRATILLLMLSRIVRTTDLSYNLHCVNDYVNTINCTLQSNQTTHLIPKKLDLRNEDENSAVSECPLQWQKDHFFCTVGIPDGFVDNEEYSICLCFDDEAESCKPLIDGYSPSETIKPKPPCCLTLSQNSSQHTFSWSSTYEQYHDYTILTDELTYQLHFFQKGSGFNEPLHVATAVKTTLTIQDGFFKPNFEYAVKVRSSPNNASYKGYWSDWSTEIYWRTLPVVEEIIPLVLYLKKVLIPVCVLIPFVLVSCSIPFKKWRRNIFIPTPEPYFHSLYTDYLGDFKSWVVLEKTVELPKTEKTLYIDKMFEYENICGAAPCVTQSSGYVNVSEPEGALLESASTSRMDSAMASGLSAFISPKSRSLAEGDSGCWLSSDPSLERDTSWYCNNYCTLSTFQQSALGTSEALKCGTRLIMELDETNEIDLIC